jgi:hypothetical protein
MNALTRAEQAEEYINRFALRELVEEWLFRASIECPEDPYQYLIDEATDQRRSGGGIVTCPNSWCNMTMPASRFPEHQATCNNAANWVRCVRCNTRVDAAKLSLHRMYCKLERCTFCGEMVLPRMLPMCPYRKVAKAERDRQAAMHRKGRRLEKEAMSTAPLLLSDASSRPSPTQITATTTAAATASAIPLDAPLSGTFPLAVASAAAAKATPAAPPVPHSQTPLVSPQESALEAVAATSTAAVRPIMKTPSTSPATLRKKASAGRGSLAVRHEGEGEVASTTAAADEQLKRRDRSAGGGRSTISTMLTPATAASAANLNAPAALDGDSGPSIPRPSFPAFLAADMALREKLESYPEPLVPVLRSIQIIWRRNMSLHLFREQVFSAVWRHMDSAQEGGAGQSKEGAAIRMVERNIRSGRRISSLDNGSGDHGNDRCAGLTAAATAAACAAAESNDISSSGAPAALKDVDLSVDDEPNPSFENDPVHISETALSNGGFMRVCDFEALTRHCQAREVLKFSVVLSIVRAASKVLRQRPLVQHITIPAKSSLVVVGDLHGQMKDLEYIIHHMGLPSTERYYLFNGDFIDRGPYGCEVLMFIYGLLCTYPDYVFLNRGNHENYSTNTEYGFMAELYAKYAGRAPYLLDAMSDSYEVMPLMSVIDHRVAVVHGGAPREACKLSEIEAIGHVRDIPVEQQTTRSEQLLAELLWNDPVEKFRSRQLGINHQGEGWRSSSRGCGVEYLTNITEQFLKNNDLRLLIRSHDVKTSGFELVHKSKSITVFSASNYGGVSGNRGAVAVLTKEAEQPVFHTWFLKEDYREHQQDGLLDGGIDVFLHDDRSRHRPGGGTGSFAGSPLEANLFTYNKGGLGRTGVPGRSAVPAITDTAAGAFPTPLNGTTGAVVVASGSTITSTNTQSPSFGGAVQPQPLKRLNAAMIAEAALLDGDEYIRAYYISSGGVLDEEDAMSDTSSRSSAFSDSEDRFNGTDNGTGAAAVAAAATATTADGAGRTSVANGRTPSSAVANTNSTNCANPSTQRWPTGTGSVSGARVTAAGSRATLPSLASHSSSSSHGFLRLGCALAQDMSIVIQLQTLQQIRELIYFQRYALLVAFNQADEMHTGIVYKAEWCVVMRDVLKLDIPWYYLCQFLAPRLVVDGVPSVEYMRFLRHFDVGFAVDFRLSWHKATIQRISSGLDLPEDIINAFCERPAMNVSGTSTQNPNTTATSLSVDPEEDRNSPSVQAKAAGDPLFTSPLKATLELPAGVERLASGRSVPSVLETPEKPWNPAPAQDDGETANATDLAASGRFVSGDEDEDEDDDEDWWCDVQLDFKTFAMRVRVLSPAAAAMEDNEIFALFCFFDVSMQGHVYVGDMVNSIIAVVDEEGSVDEAELLVSGEIDFSTVARSGRSEGRSVTRQPGIHSCSSSTSFSSSASSSSSLSGEGMKKHTSKASNARAYAAGNDSHTYDDSNSGCGSRGGVLASKLKMTGGKSRLMRPPSPSSSGEDERACNASDAAHVDGAAAPQLTCAAESVSEAGNVTQPYAFPSMAPTQDLLVKVSSDRFAKVGEEKLDIANSASRTAPGSLLGGGHPLHPSSGNSTEETDTNSSVASTRPTASGRNSDAVEPARGANRESSRSDLQTVDSRGEFIGSSIAPLALAETPRSGNITMKLPKGPSTAWVLPLEYDEDETGPDDAGATAPPESFVRNIGTPSHAVEPAVAEAMLEAAESGGDLAAAAADKVGSGMQLTHQSFPRSEARADDSTKAYSSTGATTAITAAPIALQLNRSFNEYAASMTSVCSVSAAALGTSRPFDDYSTGLFHMNSNGGASSCGTGVNGTNAGQLQALEKRVNKRLAMPPWIYPTLLRVQEQLLGGYTRLRFLFQTLNRSRNGLLTESEFLPLMTFVNCLLEHPLSAEQVHLLFVYVHDSAINYVQSVRNHRRQRSGSLYNERSKSAAEQDSVSTSGAMPAEALPPLDGCSYARRRTIHEQMRGERYILLIEFLDFFGVKPVQHGDEMEGLEELLYVATGSSGSASNQNAATTMNSTFGDAMRDSSINDTDNAHTFVSNRVESEDNAASSRVSAVVSAGGATPAVFASSLDSAKKHLPPPIQTKGQSAEAPTPLRVADTTDIATQPQRAGAGGSDGGVLSPSSGNPRQRRQRSSAAAVPFSLSGGKVEGEGVEAVPQPRRSGRGSSDTIGSNNNNGRHSPENGSGCRVSGLRRRMTSVTIGGGGGGHRSSNGNAVPPGALSIGDSAAHHLRPAVLPTQMDVLTALTSLGDTYGEDITLKELMQRLSARQQPRRSRVSLPQQQQQQQDRHHPHHVPMVLGANSLTSFVSNLSGVHGEDADGAHAQAAQNRSHRHKSSEPAAALESEAGRPADKQPSPAAAPMLTVLTSPVSSSETPAMASKDGAQHMPALLRSPNNNSGGVVPAQLDSRGNATIDPEFSFASLQATLSQHGKISSRNTINSSPPVPTPPPMQALPMGRGPGVGGSSQRSNSLLEMSVLSVSARPYMLNQAPEQRVTVLSTGAFAPHYAVHAPTPAPVANFGVSLSNFMNGCSFSANGPGVDYAGKRGSSEGRYSVAVPLAPPGLPPFPEQSDGRYRRRVNGKHAAKHGTMVVMNATNAMWDNELASMSLVPSVVLPPPAPPTRQRTFYNGSSATLSEGSHMSSNVSDTCDNGGATKQRKSRRPPPPPQAEGTAASAAVGGSGESQKLVPLAGNPTNTTAARKKGESRSPPQPQRLLYVSDDNSNDLAATAAGVLKLGEGAKRQICTDKSPRPASPAAPMTATVEPSRTKAKLDSFIATAKAMQQTKAKSGTSAVTALATGPSTTNSSGGKSSIPAPPPLQLN